MDWSTWECARVGHVTFRPEEPELAEPLHTETPVGTAWKCLRCGVFHPGAPYAHGPADTAPRVWHGAQVRDRLIIRLLAVERGIRGLLILALGFVVVQVRGSQDSIEDRITQSLPLLSQLSTQAGWNVKDSKVLHLIESIIHASPQRLGLIALALLAYGTLQLVEGTGLWLVHRWAEYLTVVATSAFIPVEVYEIYHKVTVPKIGALIVNILAVMWLVWRKHLFSANGGKKRMEIEWVRGRTAVERAITLTAE